MFDYLRIEIQILRVFEKIDARVGDTGGGGAPGGVEEVHALHARRPPPLGVPLL